MKLELLGSWSFTAPKKIVGPVLSAAGDTFGAHLPDGTFEVRRGVRDVPLVAALTLPKGARVALDPRGELLAYVVESKVTLVDHAGKVAKTASLDAAVTVNHLEFRRDGRRLWVCGQSPVGYRIHAFDRDLRLAWEDALDLAEESSPSVELVHPTMDGLVVLTQAAADDPDEATTGRLCVVREEGKLEVTFEDPVIGHPCVGFTDDGAFLVGVDFSGCFLYAWPSGACEREVAQPEDQEGGLAGIVLGKLLLTERHDPDRWETTSSLLVLDLPTLQDVAVIPWTERGSFAGPKDIAGLDLFAPLGDDVFLECSMGKKNLWTCRAWRLA